MFANWWTYFTKIINQAEQLSNMANKWEHTAAYRFTKLQINRDERIYLFIELTKNKRIKLHLVTRHEWKRTITTTTKIKIKSKKQIGKNIHKINKQKGQLGCFQGPFRMPHSKSTYYSPSLPISPHLPSPRVINVTFLFHLQGGLVLHCLHEDLPCSPPPRLPRVAASSSRGSFPNISSLTSPWAFQNFPPFLFSNPFFFLMDVNFQ